MSSSSYYTSGSSRSSYSTTSSRDPYYKSTTSSSGGPYYGAASSGEYRSSTAKDYKKQVTLRGTNVIHNENARGYNQADPHPSYGGAYSR